MTMILTMMLMTNGDNILFKNDDIRCDDIKDDDNDDDDDCQVSGV